MKKKTKKKAPRKSNPNVTITVDLSIPENLEQLNYYIEAIIGYKRLKAFVIDFEEDVLRKNRKYGNDLPILWHDVELEYYDFKKDYNIPSEE